MWTLEIKRGVVLLTLCGSVVKMKTGSVVAVADAGPNKVQLQCYLAVNLLYPDTVQRQGRTVLRPMPSNTANIDRYLQHMEGCDAS